MATEEWGKSLLESKAAIPQLLQSFTLRWWHRFHFQAHHCSSRWCHFCIRHDTALLVISFVQRQEEPPPVLNQMHPTQWRTCFFSLWVSQLSPAQLSKEGNSCGGWHIREYIYIAECEIKILGLHLKAHRFQLVKHVHVKFCPASPPRQLAGMSALDTASDSTGILNNYPLK